MRPMSFYTSLLYYRPTPPPIITGPDLAAFVRAFDQLAVSTENGPYTLQIKFGKAIDQDDKPAHWMQPMRDAPGISTLAEIDWDIDKFCGSLEEDATQIGSHEQPIYRGFLSLGSVVENVGKDLRRAPCADNDQELCFDDWNMTIGPVQCSSLQGKQFSVGWIALKLSGYGYLFPWTFAHLVRRAERNPTLQKVTRLLQETWPVPAKAPLPEHVAERKMMGELWPYPDLDRPWDWYWGLRETG
jgi:hypothetical protein